MKTKKWVLALLVGIYLVPSGFVRAEMTPGEVELTKEMIQVQHKAIVEKNMYLEKDAAEKFWPLYNQYQEALKKPNEKFAQLLNDYASNWTDVNDEKSRLWLTEFLQIKSEQIKLRQAWSRKFLKTLPAKAVARYFQIEAKMDSIVNFGLAENVPLVH
jgi:hypothetical protein